jgi:CRISPR-associated endonuclease/helicase Cas3
MRKGETITEALWERFERNQEALPKADKPVNRIRKEIYDHCLDAAEQPTGLFRLTVPTGGGKTRSGMAFALRHALHHKMQRVIVAVPFLTITDQTAKTYHEIFEDADDEHPVVLEHHSMADRNIGDDEEEDFRPEEVWCRLAAENWDAPIIVTTTVQLFESLFAKNRTGTRKLHRLAGSVIIIDEAQTLPAHLLQPILDALKELCSHYGSTVVISTATQPAFEAIKAFKDVQAVEIVPNPERYFEQLRRVDYEWRIDQPLAWNAVADFIRAEKQALAIVNTKKDSLALLDALDDPDAFHLSTLLCGAHRRLVVDEVKRRLSSGEPCRLVATQVVEAGVDIDFPLVLRAIGPLDSIIQAAGRCNREGRLERGRVIVFQPTDGGMPRGSYRIGASETQTLLGDSAEWRSIQTTRPLRGAISRGYSPTSRPTAKRSRVSVRDLTIPRWRASSE